MTTHVFIVDADTFPIHLQYKFVGTGAKEHKIDFNNKQGSTLHYAVENMLSGMISDCCRIRKDDKILFYLQQNMSRGIIEGKFYGIFKAVNDWGFLENNTSSQYLKEELGKSLTFRSLIEIDEVFSAGVTEWEALDEIKNIQSPNQMLWSLIYRKLKGNRGNTMITIYESERLCQLIRDKNSRKILTFSPSAHLDFDIDTQTIVLSNTSRIYKGPTDIQLEMLPRLIAKYTSGKAFESQLQAYIVKNIGKRINPSLDDCLLSCGSTIEWLGNEVSCGVGMQRIDIMISESFDNGHRNISPVELKAVEANQNNAAQIGRYVDWIEQYYKPNRQSDISPVLIAMMTEDKTSESYACVLSSLRDFNAANIKRCNPIKFIEYTIDKKQLVFKEVKYQ